LKSLIPGILYKDLSSDKTASSSSSSLTGGAKSSTNEEAATIPEAIIDPTAEMEKMEKELQELENESLADSDVPVVAPTVALDEDKDAGDEASSLSGQPGSSAPNMKTLMDVFINQLPNCVNRELIDRAAKDFCMNLNSKTNRKRLVSALFQVQRTRLDLLPFYARLVATLNPLMSELSSELSSLLQNDFRYHVRKKDQINIETKIKTSRFIGELVKFNVFAKTDALNCLKTLLADFRHHNIEMFCNLLDVCGRYLYRQVESHMKLKLLLEILMRKKQAAMSMDSRYTIMIENAFYYCNPPDNK
jgi:regulator of nonsense transcripts 2